MSKSIIILKGSPREHGNSSTLADQVAAGAHSKIINIGYTISEVVYVK
jgi:multimeric flavodoxin WrbA